MKIMHNAQSENQNPGMMTSGIETFNYSRFVGLDINGLVIYTDPIRFAKLLHPTIHPLQVILNKPGPRRPSEWEFHQNHNG